jgi:hypothetical protein
MRTNSELLERAYGIAEAHFYSDDECEIAWEPFEDFSDEDLKDQLHDLAQVILHAMQWAQGVENG